MFNFNKRGQGTLEYAVVIAVIVGALLAIQVYFKRGVQGRLKQATDDIGEQFSAKAGKFNTTTYSSSQSLEATSRSSEDAEKTITSSDVDQFQNKTSLDVITNTTEGWDKPKD